MIYVAGKIRNLVNYDIPFLAAKKYLNKRSLEHVTAVELLNSINYTLLSEYMIINEINRVIYNSEYIFVIPNWHKSDGTQFEITIAKYYNKKIAYLQWNELFDSLFIDDFQKFFEIDFNNHNEDNKSYKHLLVFYLSNFIDSFTKIGNIIYTKKSNAYSQVANAINMVNYIFDGLQGLELKNEYLYKKELIEKFIRGYYEG